MANYKEIQGFPIQNLTTDPTPYAQALADNPYAGSWSSGGSLNTARNNLASVGVNAENVLAVSGEAPPNVTNVEQYDGSAWTEIADVNSARRGVRGFGTYTSGIIAGGYPYVAVVESWNGSAWTEVGDLNVAKAGMGSSGSSNTAGIVFGGNTPTRLATTESWDGSSWTEVADLNTARDEQGGAGNSKTAALCIGGGTGSNSALNESWDGSSWTEVGDLVTATKQQAASGTYTSALSYGGDAPSGTSTNTQSWDGTSWTEVNDLSTARYKLGGTGANNTSALAFGGFNASDVNQSTTEEWAFSGLPPATPAADYSDAIIGQMYYNSTTGQFKTVNDGGPPIGSWSSGGNLPQNMINQGAFGGRDSVTTGGGSTATARVGDSFQYDGASWSEIAELNTARDQLVGLGTQNSGLVGGGALSPAPAPVTGAVENWNGSSWTEVADLSPVRTGAGSAGVYTAGLVFGGNVPPLTASTMTWDGSSWTEVADLNSARNRFMGQAIGTQTAALAVEGEGVNGTESWNGSAWTEVADLNTARHLGGGSGLNTSAIVSSGRTGAPGYTPNAACESWDGSSWTEVADVSSARAYLSSAGTAAGNTNSESVIFGGATTSSTANTNATEEWNAAPFEIKTMTTS